jgi:hypothetical protein
MNLRPISVGILAAALGGFAALPLSAASQKSRPVSVPVQTVTVASNGGMKIAIGSDFGDVLYAMKFKNRETLASNVWVFSDFHANPDSNSVHGCRYLVVTIANEKVASLRLVNQPAVAEIAADLRLGSQARNVASRQRLEEPRIESLLLVRKGALQREG